MAKANIKGKDIDSQGNAVQINISNVQPTLQSVAGYQMLDRTMRKIQRLTTNTYGDTDLVITISVNDALVGGE